ncbi:MAG: hypothetical protein ACL93V_03345 [Candidatus Electrothrix sp. YB6]
MNKLCKDLQYVDRMDHPEDFVSVVKTFELPEGVDPKDYARPGVDPVALLNALDKKHVFQTASQEKSRVRIGISFRNV